MLTTASTPILTNSDLEMLSHGLVRGPAQISPRDRERASPAALPAGVRLVLPVSYNPRIILALDYNMWVAWDVEVTDDSKAWWSELADAERISVGRAVLLLEERGPHLPFPYSSGLKGSRYSAMRELRVQHQDQPYRVLYIFAPRRVALLLLGGDKTGDDRWYEKNIPLADLIYDNYLAEMEDENNAKDDKVQ